MSPATYPAERATSPEFLLDLSDQVLHFRGRTVRLRPKCYALLGLLARQRLLDETATGGWVDADEIAGHPEWSGDRTRASLESQIRREVKLLRRNGIDIIETPPARRLKGPFRLTVVPDGHVHQLEALLIRFGGRAATQPSTAGDLFQWLEDTEPVWRAAYTFDKAGEALSNTLEWQPPHEPRDFALIAMSLITRARRLREMGRFSAALEAIADGLEAARQDASPDLRTHLTATCHLQEGWVRYRTKRTIDADRAVASALRVLDGSGYLRLRGQVLCLRALIRRSRGQFQDAIDDLRSASRVFLVEVDLYNLMSVYHNLSTILSEQADSMKDATATRALLLQAIACAKKSDDYCRQYRIGQNSVVSKLQLSSLYSRLGDSTRAKRYADDAFSVAYENQNQPEFILAHQQRIRLMLSDGLFTAAASVQRDFLELLEPPDLRSAIDDWFRTTLAELTSRLA